MRLSLHALHALLAGAAAALMLGACGDNGQGGSVTVTTGSEGGPARSSVSTHDIYYDPATIAAPAGKIEIELVEHGSQTHTLMIDGIDGFKLSVTTSHRHDSASLDLEPGKYTYYCDIPGHRAQGMQGTLTLR